MSHAMGHDAPIRHKVRSWSEVGARPRPMDPGLEAGGRVAQNILRINSLAQVKGCARLRGMQQKASEFGAPAAFLVTPLARLSAPVGCKPSQDVTNAVHKLTEAAPPAVGSLPDPECSTHTGSGGFPKIPVSLSRRGGY